MKATRVIAVLGIAFCVASCSPDKSTPSRARDTQSLPTITPDEPQKGATGIPIDPSKKDVVIVTPSGAARTPQESMQELQVQNAKTGAAIDAHMRTYSENLHDPDTKARVAKEMADDLETYKRQSLEMYRLQKQNEGETPK